MKLEQLENDIELQREENVRLFEIFQYRMQDEEMQPLLKKWRDGSKRLKQLISQRNEIVDSERKRTKESSRQVFMNGYGEATEREITSTTYIRADRALSKQIMSLIH